MVAAPPWSWISVPPAAGLVLGGCAASARSRGDPPPILDVHLKRDIFSHNAARLLRLVQES